MSYGYSEEQDRELMRELEYWEEKQEHDHMVAEQRRQEYEEYMYQLRNDALELVDLMKEAVYLLRDGKLENGNRVSQR